MCSVKGLRMNGENGAVVLSFHPLFLHTQSLRAVHFPVEVNKKLFKAQMLHAQTDFAKNVQVSFQVVAMLSSSAWQRGKLH